MVSAANLGYGNPAGVVQFFVDGQPYQSTMSLDAGVAEILINSWGAGTHLVTAAYASIHADFADSETLVGLEQIVSPAPLTISADNKSKSYGDADPHLAYTLIGLRLLDGPSVLSGTLVREPGESVGEYAIGPGSLSVGSNYTIMFTTGGLTIAPRRLSVTADPQTKIYGDAEPMLTYGYGTLFNGDTSSVFAGAGTGCR